MLTLPLWVAFTLIASVAQTFRNAAQRDLINTIGTAGATYVRFLFGLPFALVFLALVSASAGSAPPPPNPAAMGWIAVGALTQILATGLMLAAMRERSFVVATAYTKTEPVQVALFGLVFLGDRLSHALALAIALATAGVLLVSWPRYGAGGGLRPALYGLASASFFALSAIGYRGGILALGAPLFVLNASCALALGLALQTGLILAYLALFDRRVLQLVARSWRPSLLAGFAGAFASQFWFLGFAVASAAQVRTLSLVEVVWAQIVSRKIFQQGVSAREILGVAMIVAGVALLLNS